MSAEALKHLPPLAPVKTKDAAFDKLVRRLEVGDPSALAALAATARADWAPLLLARLVEATAGIGALQDVEQAGPRAVYVEVFKLQEPRRAAIEMLSRALAPRLAEDGIEATLVELFTTHPWHLARLAVGRGLLAGAPSRSALERVAEAMDDPGLLVWLRHTGIAAAVRLDPGTAFDRLGARLERAVAAEASDIVRGFVVALAPRALRWPEPPIDPRFYAVLAPAFDGPDGVVVAQLFKAHPDPAAVSAALDLLDRRTASRQTWLGSLGFTFMAWKKPETTPALLRAVAAALGAADAQLTGPLDVLEAIGDASVAKRLRDLAERAAPAARLAIDAVLKSLAPAETPKTTVEPSGTASERVGTGGASLKTERAALAERLVAAKLGKERALQIADLARNRITVRAKPAKKNLAPGASRLGGAPAVPKGTRWPRHEKVPLPFVGQIDLAAVATFDISGLLPRTGWLAFFARQEETVDETGDLAVLASAVLYFDGEIEPLAFPKTLDDRFRAAALTFGRDLPAPPQAVVERLGLVISETTAYETIEDDTPAKHAMLGHARAGYFKGLPAPGETLLLQVATDSAPGFLWGDASAIFFVIADADLAARRFERARCLADEG